MLRVCRDRWRCSRVQRKWLVVVVGEVEVGVLHLGVRR
jgi:hypothetical protein